MSANTPAINSMLSGILLKQLFVLNTEIHQSPPKYTEIHHKASIYLPKYTHTSIVMVQVAVMFGYVLFLINIGGTRAKYVSRLLV